MRPESPTEFKQSFLERIGVHRQLSFLSRIVLRQLERRPIRAMLSSIGMAFALALLIFSFFMEDSMTYLMDVQYDITQREDVNIAFVESRPLRALEEIKAAQEELRGMILKQKHVSNVLASADAYKSNKDLRVVKAWIKKYGGAII